MSRKEHGLFAGKLLQTPQTSAWIFFLTAAGFIFTQSAENTPLRKKSTY